MIANVLVFVAIAVAGGLGSSWYMIERGSALTTRTQGPWVTWTAAGRADADPYTRAHFARRGVLPMSSTIALSYEARRDSEGRPLNAGCDYAVEGDDLPAAWWSLAVYDEAGRLIANPAERYAYNSATVMRNPGGRFSITLARSVRPGNWLPTGPAGRFMLVLNLEEPHVSVAAPEDAGSALLPQIKRTACR